ncbi:OmpA family protein [Methylobacterium sp. NMS12]|uniref:OmpA family protein n=1 Tax=Methylobacterium sp. NMS12 TaxID=3079766 RepID=UPI003F884985
MRALKPVGILLALACAASGIGAAPARAQDPAAASPAFAPDAVPVSEAPLGRFPYFALPDGYQPLNLPETREFGHFLFWTGTALHEVEGRVFLSLIGPRDGKTFSAYELRKNVEAVLTQAGGRKIADGRIPASVTETLPEDIRVGMYEGLGNVYGAPAQTWVIRRPDRQIWVHFVPDSNGAAWTILETRPFVQTAALLPAEQLKQDLDRTGKAVIRVNFATDRTEILPASAPQIDTVVALLRTDPGLRLAINGHTDGTGAAAHNRTLSDRRAKAVMAKLVAAGIARDRLRAQGFGAASPVAANDGEAGRAQNRRVELVRF